MEDFKRLIISECVTLMKTEFMEIEMKGSVITETQLQEIHCLVGHHTKFRRGYF